MKYLSKNYKFILKLMVIFLLTTLCVSAVSMDVHATGTYVEDGDDSYYYYDDNDFFDEDFFDDDDIESFYGGYYDNYDTGNKAFSAIFMIIFIFIIFKLVAYCLGMGRDESVSNGLVSDKLLQDGSEYVIPELKDVEPDSDVPCYGDIYRFFYFVNEAKLINAKKRGGLFSAILFKWMLSKEADYEELEENNGYAIDLHPFDFANLYEQRIYNIFMEAAGENKLLEKNEFEKYCVKHYKDIEALFKEILRYEKSKLIDEGTIVVSYNTPGAKNKKTSIYTDKYMAELRNVIGFYKYLSNMTYIDEKEVEEVYIWDEYFIYSAVVNLTDKVYKQLAVLYPQYKNDPYYTEHYAHCNKLHTVCYQGVERGYSSTLK